MAQSKEQLFPGFLLVKLLKLCLNILLLRFPSTFIGAKNVSVVCSNWGLIKDATFFAPILLKITLRFKVRVNRALCTSD